MFQRSLTRRLATAETPCIGPWHARLLPPSNPVLPSGCHATLTTSSVAWRQAVGRFSVSKLQLGGYVREGCLGVSTNSLDGTQANNNDQSEHNCIFNCSWAVFRLQETIDLLCEILHGISPKVSRPAGLGKQRGTTVNPIFNGSPQPLELDGHDNF